VQVEGLLDDEDFKMKVLREELETMCADMFDRVTEPIKDALKASEITLVCGAWVVTRCGAVFHIHFTLY